MSFNASTAGLRVLRHVLKMPYAQSGHILGEVKAYLTYDEELKALDFIRSFGAKHGKLPHPDTVLEQVSVFLPESKETLSFEIDQVQNRYIEAKLREASDRANTLIAENKSKEALKMMIGDLMPITHAHAGYNLTNLQETKIIDHYLDVVSGKAPPTEKMGYPYMDSQGGIEDGDMIGIIGRPGSGKTWIMLWTAINHWMEYGEPHMFVTQEMSAKQIEKRALPMVAGVDPTPLFKGEKLQYETGVMTHEEYLDRLELAKQNINKVNSPFLIYDSKMAGTVSDIEAIASMHGVKRVWIDGAYMLRHPDPRLGRYARVPENLDLMKQWQQRTGVATFSSWQFKRNAGKVSEEGDTPDLDDIGYSHAIPEYMGIIMALLENPQKMKEQGKKEITVMKGRNGEQGEFNIHWNVKACNFSEAEDDGNEMDHQVTYL